MKPLPKAEADQQLRSRKGMAPDLLRRLPHDVDAALAARLVLDQVRDGYSAWALGRLCQQVPPSVIRAVLAQLPREPRSAERIFLMESVSPEIDDAALLEAWVAALQALLDLSLTYSWGSKQRKAKLRALAAKPHVVSAIQAAVVGAETTSVDMLAVLAIEASEASIDALLPVFSKGNRDSGLEMLQVHATMNAAMKALLSAVTERRIKKEEHSSAVEFVSKVLGLDEPLKAVKCMVWLSSEQDNRNGVPLYQGSITLDSRWDDWWSVGFSRVDDAKKTKSVSFGANGGLADDFGVGACTIDELPKWLAAAAKKLKVSWNRRGLATGSLRGKKREQFTAWVFSALPS